MSSPRLSVLDLSTEGEALDLIQQIDLALSRNVMFQREANRFFIRGKFTLGESVVWLMENEEMPIEEIAESTKVSKRSLYDARRFYLRDGFGRRPAEMEKWLEEMTEVLGVKLTWRWVLDWMKGGSRSKKSNAEKAIDFARKVVSDADRAAEQLTKYLSSGGDEDVDEAMSLGSDLLDLHKQTFELADEAEDLLAKVPRSQHFIDFTRSCERCCVSGLVGHVDPHHIEQGSMDSKGSDFTCIPVCRQIHIEIEDKGHKYVEKKYNIRFDHLLSEHLLNYIHAINGFGYYECNISYA